MSRIGKKVIQIPKATEIVISGSNVMVKGPKGNLERVFTDDIEIVSGDGTITINPKKDSVDQEAMWGTSASHIINMMKGVNEAFVKKLIIEGIGYKGEVKGTDLVLALGFSHPVKKPIPADLKVTTDKNIVTISGINKESVGRFAAEIRALKKPEPYKGKGIRYEGEVVRRKQGKKAA